MDVLDYGYLASEGLIPYICRLGHFCLINRGSRLTPQPLYPRFELPGVNAKQSRMAFWITTRNGGLRFRVLHELRGTDSGGGRIIADHGQERILRSNLPWRRIPVGAPCPDLQHPAAAAVSVCYPGP
jgi:hypothetical protein